MAQPVVFAAGDRAVAAIIRDHAFVLIQRLRHGQAYYVLPGGSIEADETPEAACLREVEEETGLHGIVQRSLGTLINRRRVEHYFLVTVTETRLALGGPERERSTPDNVYRPLWVGHAQLPALNLQPQEARLLILSQL